ncbi:MAG: GNAT family N-acetyltransferase [Akkermansiaceae bacterium]|nr:GNAT family N-acetyltransferase [Akkermansiaceae bacterium]
MGVVNIRSVLEYVPYFRGKLFIVHIAAPLLASVELVDALLDLAALQEIGVRLVVVAEGDELEPLYKRTQICEMRSACVAESLASGDVAFRRVREILGRSQIPVVTAGGEGAFDRASVSLALSLGAAKYIVLLDNQVPKKDGSPIFSILEKDVAALEGVTDRELLLQAAGACRSGIPRVHLLNGRSRGVLGDELFSEEGVGTMVHTDSYREIRPLSVDDIPCLLSMIARSVVDSALVDRSYEDIFARIDSYFVFTLDESIVGCVAIYPYPEDDCAELGCLYIKKNHEGHGYGRALCRFAEERARQLGLKHIFAISKSAVDYFRDRLHYDRLSRDVLPVSRRLMLERSGRCSEVFGRSLSPRSAEEAALSNN